MNIFPITVIESRKKIFQTPFVLLVMRCKMIFLFFVGWGGTLPSSGGQSSLFVWERLHVARDSPEKVWRRYSI